MKACMQAKIDFSVFILLFNFFNGFVSSERYDFAKNAHFSQLSAFSSGQVLSLPLFAR